MICSHCNNEVEKYAQKKDKICKSCYQRINNCKSRGIKYIKFIDLPEEEKQKFLNRSKVYNNKENNIKEKKEKVDKKPKELKINENTKIIVHKTGLNEKDIVIKDIENTLKENELKWPKDTTSIVPIFKQLKILLDNYINPYLNVEDVLNKMELDYKHAKEYYSSLYKKRIENNDTNDINRIYNMKCVWEERHNILLELRRSIKNVVSEYYAAGIIFTELGKNKEFMEKFNKCYDSLIKMSEILKDGSYKAKVSKLVADEDFCSGLEESNYKGKVKFRYEVIIKTYSSPKLIKIDGKFDPKPSSTDTFHRTVWATGEEDAKQQVINFIKEKKFSFTYNEKEIIVNKISGNVHN